MNIETLENIGLSSNEARVYLALLELGSSTAGKITEKSKVNRRTVYDVLESLINKGLVSYIIEANKKMFEATNPKKFLDLIQEREKEVKQAMPELQAKRNATKDKQEVTIYRGKKGIKTVFEDILKHNQYNFFGSHGRSKEIMGPYFELFQKTVIKNKIKSQGIISERLSKLWNKKNSTKHAQIRFLKKEYDSPISTLIYGNKVAIIVWSNEPICTLFRGKAISKSFKNYFDIMWEIAKE